MSNPISADELNYLIFRYLQESGFTHTAFMFAHESGGGISTIDGNFVPVGALVNVVVKGLQEIGLEANTVNLKKDEEVDFIVLDAMELVTKEIDELQIMVRNKTEKKDCAAAEHKETEEASNRMKDNYPGKQSTQLVGKSSAGKRSQQKGKRKVHFGCTLFCFILLLLRTITLLQRVMQC